jgi:hypothetical protein
MPQQFTTERLVELVEAYAEHVVDASGLLTTNELPALLRSLGQSPTEAELQEMSQVAADWYGAVSFHEFVTLTTARVEAVSVGVNSQKKRKGVKRTQGQQPEALQGPRAPLAGGSSVAGPQRAEEGQRAQTATAAV